VAASAEVPKGRNIGSTACWFGRSQHSRILRTATQSHQGRPYVITPRPGLRCGPSNVHPLLPAKPVPEFGACPSDAGASQNYWLLHLAILVLSKDTTVSLLTRYQTLLILRGKVSRHCKAFTDAMAHEFGVGSQQAEKVGVNMSINYRVERNSY